MNSCYTMLFIFLLASQIGFPQIPKQKFNAYSGTLVFTAEGGITLGYTEYDKQEVDYLAKGALEYFFPTTSNGSFGLRIFSGGGFLSGKDPIINPDYFRTKFAYIGGGGTFALSIEDLLFPYASAGVSYFVFSPRGRGNVKLPNHLAGRYSTEEFNVQGEIGVRVMLADNLSFNINGGFNASPKDNLDDLTAGTKTDLFFIGAAGFSYSFFTKKDSDNDGVDDSKDMCPGTKKGVKVDEFGCPLDADRDGVPDFSDKCAGTPLNVKVDAKGCPLNSDGDKVPDYIDICPETPSGVPVDELGCPTDNDSDGVPDFTDECPNSPPDAPVDKKGCPVDSDGDNVPDYMDQCPGTPAGENVDETGCSIVVKQMVLSGGANFAFGSTDLLPVAYNELDKIIEVMKLEPSSRWRIEGHTDDVGAADLNQRISLKRAQAVESYFISRGISKSRLEVIGFGEDVPVANNTTEEGRAQNRRVVIIRIN